MKQTAVEWLADKMLTESHSKIEWDRIVEQAKDMEKEQIEDAWQNGIENCGEFNNPTIVSGKQYYNETYESNN